MPFIIPSSEETTPRTQLHGQPTKNLKNGHPSQILEVKEEDTEDEEDPHAVSYYQSAKFSENIPQSQNFNSENSQDIANMKNSKSLKQSSTETYNL
jgi:hypothetical protein